MEYIQEKYIYWDFDREFSKTQKIKRLYSLARYVHELEKKLFCYDLSKFTLKQIERKRVILLFEFLDLSEHLDYDKQGCFNQLYEKVNEGKLFYKKCWDCCEIYKDCICQDERCENCNEKIDECEC